MALEIERKFLLTSPPDLANPILGDAHLINFEQVYLEVSDDEQRRIRRGRTSAGTAYHFAHLRRLSTGVREVTEYEIDAAAYVELRTQRDPARQIIVKDRYCFHWRNQFFELDEIQEPTARACHILEIQVDDLGDEITLPTFLKIDREVTGDPGFSNAMIALG